MAGHLSTTEDLIAERELNTCDTESDKNDPFGSESHGTARYVGVGSSTSSLGGAGAALGVVSTLGSKFDCQTMKAANNQKSSRMDLPRSELIKMLVYLEGELQARDVVIAALRNERVKHLITQLRTNPIQSNDPHAAMFRDKIALCGNLISRQSSTTAVQAEMEVRIIIEQQMESLYQMVHKQRATHVRMVSILTDSLDNNQRMLQELEEEKRKHEHDTAQGDDITYGLEMERTKLRQELEAERAQTKKLEKDIKKLQETMEFERGRQKQIVLLLIAERKKILMKYIEEGKRSEDLAQILNEEKQRSDSIAEGLEEESKKSLRMEAEIEKQTITFENERKTLRLTLVKEEKRIKELETEINQLKTENEALKKNTATSRIQNLSGPTIPAKSRPIDDSCGTPSSLVNIAKIVQPTATVSSVPVSGPTTGIARSISPGQTLRTANIIGSDQNLPPLSGMNTPPTKINNSSHQVVQTQQQTTATNVLGTLSTVSYRTSPAAPNVSTSIPIQLQQQSIQQQHFALPHINSLPSNNSNVTCSNSTGSSIQIPAIVGQSGTGHTLIGTALPQSTVPNTNIIASVTVTPIPIATSTVVGTRGVPPPIPPNKPVVPPKREPSIPRVGSLAANNSK